MLQGEIAEEVAAAVRGYADRMGGEVLELSVQIDHVHLQVMVPPKVSISKFVGTIKGRTAIQILNRHKKLKQKGGVARIKVAGGSGTEVEVVITKAKYAKAAR